MSLSLSNKFAKDGKSEFAKDETFEASELEMSKLIFLFLKGERIKLLDRLRFLIGDDDGEILSQSENSKLLISSLFFFQNKIF